MRRRKTNRIRKKSSTRTEKRVAKEHGGTRTPRSGAGFIKGDGRVPKKYRIENKETDNLSYSLHTDELNKLNSAALSAGEIPVFHLKLTDRNGRKHEVVVLRYKDHLAMVKDLEEEE